MKKDVSLHSIDGLSTKDCCTPGILNFAGSVTKFYKSLSPKQDPEKDLDQNTILLGTRQYIFILDK